MGGWIHLALKTAGTQLRRRIKRSVSHNAVAAESLCCLADSTICGDARKAA